MNKATTTRAKSLAKFLRKSMTQPELSLWLQLRHWRNQGLPIRRQHAIGQYIVDFAHLQSKVVIEVDGNSHNESNQEHDQIRQNYLESLGYQVVRITNDDALKQTDQIASHLFDLITDRMNKMNQSP